MPSTAQARCLSTTTVLPHLGSLAMMEAETTLRAERVPCPARTGTGDRHDNSRGTPRPRPQRKIISINRSPMLTLWASVVAPWRRVGRDETITLGQAVAGLNADKGRQLGLL